MAALSHTVSQVDIEHPQVHQLADPKAGGVKRFEHGTVAKAERRGKIGCLQQRLDLRLAERFGKPRGLLRGLQSQAGIVIDEAMARRPEKVAAQGGQPPVGGGSLAAGVHGGEPCLDIGFRGMGKGSAGVRQQPAVEALEVAAVSAQRIVRQTVFEPQGVNEAVDAVGFGSRGHGDMQGTAALAD